MNTAKRNSQLPPHALNDDSPWQDDTANTNGLDLGGFIQYLAEAVLVVSPDGVIECANAKAALLLLKVPTCTNSCSVHCCTKSALVQRA